MAAISRNKFDVYTWIIKIINSCENAHQLVIAHQLIRNFRDKYRDSFLEDKLWKIASQRFSVNNIYNLLH